MTKHGRFQLHTARVLTGPLVAGFALAAGAHHGWSGYDANKPLNLTGTI